MKQHCDYFRTRWVWPVPRPCPYSDVYFLMRMAQNEHQEHMTEGASYLENCFLWKFAKHDLVCKTAKWVIIICGRELTVHFYQA